MHGIDPWLAGTGGGGAVMALVAALLLGLRHATDPDHLAALSTLALSEGVGGRRAAGLGLAWGAGHATTLFALGVPAVLFGHYLPKAAQRGAEVAVGLVIAALAVRLLVRWKRGHFHAHPHEHDGVVHSHPHFHELEPGEAGEGDGHPAAHRHRHAEAVGRTPLAAYGIGLVHGVGGSAAAGVLLVASAPTPTAALAALALFAGGTAASMAGLSGLFGRVFGGRGGAAARLESLVPAFGAASLLFGLWYVAMAL